MPLTTFNRMDAYAQYRTIMPLVKRSPLSLKNIIELLTKVDPIILTRSVKPPIIKSKLPVSLLMPVDL